ncbi:Multidrug resistance protein 1A [Talaromyces islandicus]|uniref:ABC multidrug transporter MDR2 n=1 Tax=Talaromyces islandicus TaxID=28573 RepID=A0A0U1M3U3_TALIS|nr:Multidrug resistance protein 1A [Talaromyces islandicus]
MVFDWNKNAFDNYKIQLIRFIRIFSYSTKSDRLFLFAATIASICTGVTLPLMNVVFAQIAGVFTEFYTSTSSTKQELGFRTTSIRISSAMRLAYIKALLDQPIALFDSLPPGQTAAIITITANNLQIGISERLSMFIQSITIGLVAIVVFYRLTIPLIAKFMKEVEHADGMSASVAVESFSSIKMVAACGAEGTMAKRYAAWVETARKKGLAISPLAAIQHSPVIFTIHATYALSFWYAIHLYMNLKIPNVTSVVIAISAIMMIVLSLGAISIPISSATRAAEAAGLFFAIIDAPVPQMKGAKTPEVSAQDDIVFERVNFSYPSRPDVQVLNNLTAEFARGKTTAIVGESGSGKSTIVGLIERWYDVGNLHYVANSGFITVGGRNLNDIDVRWWRSQIGLVQQEPFLFNDTIYKNVEYGLIGTKWEDASPEKKKELVCGACEEAFADEFISQLPEGYDTIVGDAGLKLSGGQRQRLAIARSIVKHPSILILDEATSAIDVHGERIVQEALEKISKNRTTIVIAHRLSTIMKADKIIVIKKGKLVQQGTHEELLNDKNGLYWGLANAQRLSLDSDSLTHMQNFRRRNRVPDFSPAEKLHSGLRTTPSGKESISNTTGASGSFKLFVWEQRYHWWWYTLMVLGAFGAGISFPLHAYLYANVISLFNFWGQYLRDQTNWWCLMLLLLGVGAGGSHFALGWSSNTMLFHFLADYRQEYFRNILSKPISFYDDPSNSVGNLIVRIASDPTQLQQLLGLNMALVLTSIFNVLGSILLSLYFGWKLTLMTVCTSMPVILAAGYLRMRYEVQFEKMNNEVFTESSKFAAESVNAFRTVSSLTLETEICRQYEALLQNHFKKAFRKALFSTWIFAMSDSIALLCMAFVQWYGGRLLASYEYTPFNYLIVYLAIVQGSTSAGHSLSFGPDISQAFAAANRIRSMRPEETDAKSSVTLSRFGGSQAGKKRSQGVKIELKGVSFKYPTRDVPVLNDLNMTIFKGQFAAIVGASGSGKTSIVSLIERFYDVQKGRILCNGIDINVIHLGSYRRGISLVAQEPLLFDGTIRENILLGVDETKTSDEELQCVCRDAGIEEFISSLPEKLDTKTGTRGVALSGGQKQRIAIARALIRNPRLLLLDEATSSLDSETEKSVQAVFERTRKGRTMVVVAHRLATIQNADVIFVVGDGRVAETGTHASLLKKRGIYYQMCQSQTLFK